MPQIWEGHEVTTLLSSSLNPIILNPSYVAVPTLKEFVSISPGKDLAWTALQHLSKLTIFDKDVLSTLS